MKTFAVETSYLQSVFTATCLLMSIVGKVFARVLNERVKVATVDKMIDEQGGFKMQLMYVL